MRLEGAPDRRRADLADARELHRERGRCAQRGRGRADDRGAAARVRAVRRRARARGRASSTCPSCRPLAVGGVVRRGEVRVVSRTPRQSPAREAVARLPSRARSRELLPSGRSVAVGLAVAVVAVLAYRRRARDVGLRGADDRGARRRSEARARSVERALAPLQGESLLKVDAATRCSGWRRRSRPSPASATTAPSRTRLRVRVQAGAAGSRSSGTARDAWLVSRRGRVMERIAQRTHTHAAAHLARRAARRPGRRDPRAGRRRGGGRAARRAPRRGARAAGSLAFAQVDGPVDLRAARRPPDPRRRPVRPPAEARGRAPRSCTGRRLRLPRRQRSAASGRRPRTVKSQVEVELAAQNLVDNRRHLAVHCNVAPRATAPILHYSLRSRRLEMRESDR